MKALRDGASGGITKIFLFGFMVAAVGGLVFMDVGGVFRGGISKTEVIKVGDDTVKIATFDRNLRRALSRVGMSPQDAYKLGYVQQVIGTEVRTRLLDNAARDHDIKVSDKAVAEQVAKLIAPLAKNNKQDPKDVLFQILRMQGMSEKEFSQNIAMDMGNSLMLKAIQGGFTDISDDILKDLFSYANETRDIEYIAFLDKDIEKPQAPSEEELQQLYDATKKNYAIPERRKIQLITIDTSKLEKSLTISDEEIKNTYENNIEQYTTPENWKLDQALVTTKEQADKIYEETKKGKDLKKAVEKVTSNTSSYMETQEIPENGLLPEIKDAVIAAETSTVLEPIKSPLGWHIVHIQAINKEHIKPLPEVKTTSKKNSATTSLLTSNTSWPIEWMTCWPVVQHLMRSKIKLI